MSIYTKPISQLETADLEEMLQAHAVENIRLEFKLIDPAKDETLKKLSSFANTFGGLVLIGAQANSADGRLQALTGIDPIQGYKQRIMQWSFDEVYPPLIVEVSDPIAVPGNAGKVCYAISIAESDAVPHFLHGRKGIWIRTDEFSNRFDAKLANEDEIRHLLNRRQLVRERRAGLIERARQRFNTYLKKSHTDKRGEPTTIGPLFEFRTIPRFPTKPLLAQENLRTIVFENSIDWRGQIFPDFTRRQFTFQHESVIVLDALSHRQSYFELNVWGLAYYGLQLKIEHHDAEGILTFELAGLILLYLRHAAQMYQQLGYSGPVLLNVSLNSILDVPLVHAMQGYTQAGSLSPLDSDLELSIETTSQLLAENTDGVAKDLYQSIFFAVNWPKLVETPEDREKVLKKAYEFNNWKKPSDPKK
jgi:hypothetical protein